MVEVFIPLVLALSVDSRSSGCTDKAAIQLAEAHGFDQGGRIACLPVGIEGMMGTAFDLSVPDSGVIGVVLHSDSTVHATHVIRDRELFVDGALSTIEVEAMPGLIRTGELALAVILEKRLNSWDPAKAMWVFVQSGDQLVPVLSDFEVYSFNDQIGHTSCQGGENLEMSTLLEPLPSQSEGMNDVSAVTVERRSTGEMIDGDCIITKHAEQVERRILRFRGDGYSIVGGGES